MTSSKKTTIHDFSMTFHDVFKIRIFHDRMNPAFSDWIPWIQICKTMGTCWAVYLVCPWADRGGFCYDVGGRCWCLLAGTSSRPGNLWLSTSSHHWWYSRRPFSRPWSVYLNKQCKWWTFSSQAWEWQIGEKVSAKCQRSHKCVPWWVMGLLWWFLLKEFKFGF